ncbi:MAG: valine--tRNA ligase [Candidatus Micrarchaeia archaeon]
MDKYDKMLEERIAERWVKENLYKFDEDRNKPLYIIDTPPPFTSGKLHMGHVLSYSLFDFAARFKRMRGYNVLYPQGWDTQGFPTEVKVENKYGKLPREQFVQKCKEWTHEFIATMRKQMQRMGFSADWSREYITMSPDYHKKVQLSLIKMYEDGLVYMGTHPVFWCPHCVSAIAKAETGEITRQTKLNYLKFRLEDGREIPIATTRPEYLHACVAVFVHPQDDRYKDIVGKWIETPLGKKVKVLSDIDVEKDFGTGVVMVCTFGDKQDVIWTYRHNLPIIDAIDETGCIKNSGEFDGLSLEEARKKILEKLMNEGKVIRVEPLDQVVKIHDRCETPVELKLSSQWFCKIDGYQRDIIEAAKSMKWIPEFTLQYLIDWANYIEWDWVISRKRYFGTPLPFYVCKNCGNTTAADINELPFDPSNARETKCEKCGNLMQAEESVADCWIDSSITPLIIAGWPEEGWERYYPSTLRPQGIEIIRTWAFYTIYRCTMLSGEAPFKELLLNGNVLGPDGKKMSKSLGNIVDPENLISQYSADAVRIWVALSGASTHDRPFNYQDTKFAQSFITKLWNAARFIEMACKDYDERSGNERLTQIDKWIIGKLNKVKEKATAAYESYDFFNAMNEIKNFFWHDFCDDYIEFVKYRIYGNDTELKRSAQYTLLKVLDESLRLMAPIVVFTTEEIYQQIYNKENKKVKSIHLTEWPMIEKVDEISISAGEFLSKVVGEIRKYKNQRKMSMKDEIPNLKITVTKELEGVANAVKDEIMQITNVKEIEIVNGELVAISE